MDRDRWGHDQPSPERDAAPRSDGGSDSDSEYEEETTVTRTLKKTTYNPRRPAPPPPPAPRKVTPGRVANRRGG